MNEKLTYADLREAVARAICHSEGDCSCQSPKNCLHYWHHRTIAADAVLAAVASLVGGKDVINGCADELDWALNYDHYDKDGPERTVVALLRALAEASSA